MTSTNTALLELYRQDYQDQEALVAALSPQELVDAGDYENWSFKAQVAHRNFWSAKKIEWLKDGLDGRPIVLYSEHDDVINALVYQQQELKSWEQIYSESQQIYAQMQELLGLFSDELLNSVDERFAPLTEQEPVYVAFVSNFEHSQIHLVNYALRHGREEQAIAIAEHCAAAIAQGPFIDAAKGRAAYNLACFYALSNLFEQADASLRQALELAPELREFSISDPDLQGVYERWA
jgi:tetratricopeptide (TPR) repeat protein